MSAILLIFATAAAAYGGIEIFRRWSVRRKLLDIPNERSSHTQPVPRGGGLLIVLLALGTYFALGAFFPAWFSRGYFVGAFLIAAISWIDDLRSVPFFVRLIVHFLAASLVIADLGPMAGVYIPFSDAAFNFGHIAPFVTALWVVWMINAYNFMDGIDGIAGIQGLVAAGVWLAISFFSGFYPEALFLAAIAGSIVGFLFHNWSPARIFMGDVGSAFLGYTFASIPLLIAQNPTPNSTGQLALISLLVLWPFVFDSVFTLIRRLLSGERIWEAHRSHLYQKLVIRGVSHPKVTAVYGLLALVCGLSGFAVMLKAAPLGIFPILAPCSSCLIMLLWAYRGQDRRTGT